MAEKWTCTLCGYTAEDIEEFHAAHHRDDGLYMEEPICPNCGAEDSAVRVGPIPE
jgi:ribosomal protein S27AE